jgi:hypothetical protein
MPKYEIYTTEILKQHTSYYIIADSEEEALQKLELEDFDDIPSGDIYDRKIIDIEIYEN